MIIFFGCIIDLANFVCYSQNIFFSSSRLFFITDATYFFNVHLERQHMHLRNILYNNLCMPTLRVICGNYCFLINVIVSRPDFIQLHNWGWKIIFQDIRWDSPQWARRPFVYCTVADFSILIHVDRIKSCSATATRTRSSWRLEILILQKKIVFESPKRKKFCEREKLNSW